MVIKRRASLFLALLPIVVLLLLLVLNIRNFGDDALAGANQIALLIASSVAVVVAFMLKQSWKDIRRNVVKTIGDAMPAIIILFLIGALAGTWMVSGVVPLLIYYGMKILEPTYFLVLAVVISAVVSLATGSSWSTIATIGVALFGIGKAMGFSDGMLAGAIISGAYFGDKMSPLSDTTNLAPAMAGTDLFTHVRYMVYTMVPALTLTLIIFLVLGFTVTPAQTAIHVDVMTREIASVIHLSPWLLLVPVVLVLVIVKKVSPIPSLFIGVLLGLVFAVVFQQDLLLKLAGESKSYGEAIYKAVLGSMSGRTVIETGNERLTELFTTGGMAGMLNTVWLILTAMIFSGVMESAGLLNRIAEAVMCMAKSTGSLVLSTILTSIFMNITASDQYISIVVPGRMYADIYRRKGYKPELLSRTLEDGGTVTSVLVPWNTGGAVQSSVLGVPTLTYVPYAFFNWITPLVSVLFAYLNIKIRRFSKAEMEIILKEEEHKL